MAILVKGDTRVETRVASEITRLKNRGFTEEVKPAQESAPTPKPTEVKK